MRLGCPVAFQQVPTGGTLRIEYRDDDRARRIEPHAVVVRDGRWYVVAWEGDAADWRILRLDRVRVRQGGGVPFEPREIPTGDARTYLSARFKGSGEQDRWPVTADLILSTPAQRVVPFLGDAELEDLGDGRSRVRVGSWSWAGALAWALRFDVPFEVVGPPELADAAGTLGRRLSDSAAGPGIR